jgi:hypothetical protein
MGEYGGGVVGNAAVEGVRCKLTTFATVVVVGATVVGGLVVGGLVVVGGTVVVAIAVVVGAGSTVGVVTDACAVWLARCGAEVDDATPRGVP